MDEQLSRHYRRWLESEAAERHDDADAVFAELLRPAAGAKRPSPDFAARTMAAVAIARESDRRRARRVRRIVVPVSVLAGAAVVYASSGLILTAFSAIVVRMLDVLVSTVVGLATTTPAGGDLWTLVTSLGRAGAALLTNPAITTTILALQLVAAMALVALQRLLRSDRESFR